MDLIIKEKAINKVNLSFNQACYLLSLRNRLSQEEFQFLLDNKFIYINAENNICLNGGGYNAITEMLRLSNIVTTSSEDVENLARNMAEIFPAGKKIGTNKYWRGNSALVIKKLNGFLRKYGLFPDEVILKATKAYVDSFGIDTSLMRILPYFIEKDNESDLLTFIENLDSIDETGSSVFSETLL